MRNVLFATVSGAALSLISLSAYADDQGRVESAQYSAGPKVICMYQVHEGMLIRRPDCRPAHIWAAERERDRQDFRDFIQRSFTQRPR